MISKLQKRDANGLVMPTAVIRTVVRQLGWFLLFLGGGHLGTVVEGTDGVSRRTVAWTLLCPCCCY